MLSPDPVNNGTAQLRLPKQNHILRFVSKALLHADGKTESLFEV